MKCQIKDCDKPPANQSSYFCKNRKFCLSLQHMDYRIYDFNTKTFVLT